jgi:hypothetical protein
MREVDARGQGGLEHGLPGADTQRPAVWLDPNRVLI